MGRRDLRVLLESPCKDCDKRPPDRGCGNHANCEDYICWRAEYEKVKGKIISEKEKQKALDEVTYSGMMRVKNSFSRKRTK